MKLLAFWLAALLAAAPAGAHTWDLSLGARSMGLADAMTAVPGDLSALALNPAALGQLRRPQVEAGLRNFNHIPAGKSDLEGMTLAGALALPEPLNGALGLSWGYDINEPVSLDRVTAVSYGTKGWREIDAWTLDIGTTLKAISRSGRGVPGSSSRVAADLGTFLKLSDDKSVGFSVLNINAPRADLSGYSDRTPTIFKLGFAQAIRRFLVAADISRRDPSAGYGTTTWASFGTEYDLPTPKYGTFAARTGLSLGGAIRAWSLGAGWSILGTRVDYAVRIPFMSHSAWSHGVSLSYRFGAWDPETEYERMLSGEINYRKDLTSALEASEVKQWKLSEELTRLREEMASLRKELSSKSSEATLTQQKLKNTEAELKLQGMENRRREAEDRLEQLRLEREDLQRRDKQGRYRDDWRAYEELKRQGAAELLLMERLKQLLREYKGTGVDLGEAQQEFQRLLRK